MQAVTSQVQENRICAFCAHWLALAGAGAALASIFVGAAAAARQALVLSDSATQLAAAIGTVAAIVVSAFFPSLSSCDANVQNRRRATLPETSDNTNCRDAPPDKAAPVPESTAGDDELYRSQSERTIRRRRSNMPRRHTCHDGNDFSIAPKLRRVRGVKRDRLIELPLPTAMNKHGACYESDAEGVRSSPAASPGLPPRRGMKGSQKGTARACSASSRDSSEDAPRFPLASRLLNLRFQLTGSPSLMPEFLILEQPKPHGTLLVADMAAECALAREDDFGSILCVGDSIAQVNGEGGSAVALLVRLQSVVSKGGKLHLGVRLRPASFRVELLRSDANTAKLGLTVGIDKRDPSKMQVRGVRTEGLAKEWNESHPERRICAGDWITEVNGQRSDAVAMHAKMQKNLVDGLPICFTVVPPPRKAKWDFGASGSSSIPPSPHGMLLSSPPTTPVAVARQARAMPCVPPLPSA